MDVVVVRLLLYVVRIIFHVVCNILQVALYCMLFICIKLYCIHVLVLYVVTLCTLAWKNSFAEC